MTPLERVEVCLDSVPLDAFVLDVDASLRDIGYRVLVSDDAEEKVALTVAAYKRWALGGGSESLDCTLSMLGRARSLGEGERKGANVPVFAWFTRLVYQTLERVSQ